MHLYLFLFKIAGDGRIDLTIISVLCFRFKCSSIFLFLGFYFFFKFLLCAVLSLLELLNRTNSIAFSGCLAHRLLYPIQELLTYLNIRQICHSIHRRKEEE